MSVRDREARRLRTLAARLDQDWRIVEAVHARVQEAVAYHLDRSSSDTVSIGAVALYLQNFYTAVEDLLKRIATELNGWAAGGEDWHRELLEQMSLEVEGFARPWSTNCCDQISIIYVDSGTVCGTPTPRSTTGTKCRTCWRPSGGAWISFRRHSPDCKGSSARRSKLWKGDPSFRQTRYLSSAATPSSPSSSA